MSDDPILAADTGGTFIKLGVIRRGEVIAQCSIPAQSDRPLAERLPVIAAEWSRLCEGIGVDVRACAGIGISFPSIMDPLTGRVLTHFGKFTDAPDQDLKAWAKDTFGLPLAIENDARAALIGEWQRGAGRGCDHLVMLTLGTGLGSAALVDGRPLRGGHGQAAIMGGHSSINYDGTTCPTCGNTGCAEHEASTASLPRLAAEAGGFRQSPLALEGEFNYEAVFRLAAAGDSVSRRLRDHSLQVWGTFAANQVLAFDPQRLIIGGGISADPGVIESIRDHVHRYALTPWGKVSVQRAELRDNAALLGCEWLARQAALHPAD